MLSKIQDVDLKDINSYLKPTKEILLEGRLNQSLSQSELTENTISTKTQILYENLKISVLKTKDRSSFIADIADVLLQGKICNTNKDREGFSITYKKKKQIDPQNSIVQSILHGLLDVALASACYE